MAGVSEVPAGAQPSGTLFVESDAHERNDLRPGTVTGGTYRSYLEPVDGPGNETCN